MQGSKLKDYLHLHLIVFIWGFTAILGTLISIDAIPLVWYRMFLASVFIAVYFLIQNKSFRIDRKSLFKFIFTGILIALHWITFFHAIKVSNVSVALVTMSIGAFFTSLIEPILFRRQIRLVEIVLGAIVVVGLSIIFTFESQYTWGIIYALISAFLSAIFSVFNGLFVKKNDAEVISLCQLFFGAVFITVYLFAMGEINLDLFLLSRSDWLYLLILSSVCTAYAFIALVKVMRSITPYTVMLTINLEPIYAIIFALIIFWEKEKMNTEFYIGACIVLFVVLLNGVLKNIKKFAKKSKNILGQKK